MPGNASGSPFAPHTAEETAAMLETIGVESIDDLFDIPPDVRFDDQFGIAPMTERETVRTVRETLEHNESLTELLGRGHYGYYVPSVVDHLADRSEFLTSYTQYQPEASQGFLQALFEYQSLLVELTGLEVANCSMYDAATALGEAATLATRVRDTAGDRVLVPDSLLPGRRETLENYVAGSDLTVESYPATDGVADTDVIADLIDEDVVMLYAETPTLRGAIEPNLSALGDLAADADACYVVGSDPVALAVLERPAAVGADVVVGDASVLGLGTSYGMGLGLFATKEEYLRDVPGRLVGVSEDATDRRAYTLTLQTREQHIRRERATSNICTNQAWVALRASMHAALLGPDGLVDLAERDVATTRRVCAALDELPGVTAPVHDRHHLREAVIGLDDSSRRVADALASKGYAVHVVGPSELQICVSGVSDREVDGFLEAVREVVT